MPAIPAATSINAVTAPASGAPEKAASSSQSEDRPFAQVFAEQTGKAAKAESKDGRPQAGDAKNKVTADAATTKTEDSGDPALAEAAVVAAQAMPGQAPPDNKALTAEAGDGTLEDKIQLVAALMQAVQPASQAGQNKPAPVDVAGVGRSKFLMPETRTAQQNNALMSRKADVPAAKDTVISGDQADSAADPKAGTSGRVAAMPAKLAAENPIDLRQATTKEGAQRPEFVLAKLDATTGSTSPVPAAVAALHAPTVAAASQGSEYRIATPVGSQPWQNAVGNSLVVMTGAGQEKAELVLTPPHLGRIEVSISMKGDEATAIFVSANPSVRDALENALPRLREVLADAGITLGQAQVGAESQGQSTAERQTGDNTGLDAQQGGPNGTPDLPDRGTSPAASRIVSRTLVDTYA